LSSTSPACPSRCAARRRTAAFGSASLYLIWAASISSHDPASTGVFTYATLSAGATAVAAFVGFTAKAPKDDSETV